MGIEYELKFRATEQVLQELDRSVLGWRQTYRMETTYYDTPTGQLSGRRYTLRRRMENGTAVCTLKAPEQGGGRGEWEVPCACIEDAIGPLCALGAPQELPLLVSEGLLAVCGARFERITRTVELPDCTLELALDRGVLTGGRHELPLCEAEVELKSGTRAACDAYARALAAKFGLEPEPLSKFRRALALYQMR